MNKRDDQLSQFLIGARAGLLDLGEQMREAIERVLMAGEQNLFLVPEVVVEVPLLHVQRRGDFLDGRAVIAELAKRFRRAFEDFDPGRRVRIGVSWPFRSPWRPSGWFAARRRG